MFQCGKYGHQEVACPLKKADGMNEERVDSFDVSGPSTSAVST